MAGKRTKPKPTGGGLGAASIEHVATDDLIPYARNARTHSDEQVAQIAGSIQEFGFNNPVLIDGQNSIIAGHGRVLAAGRLKLEQVPCIRLTHLSDAQRRAYVIADNRIAMNSGWDEELLANELSDLHADELDLGLLGFDEDELAGLLNLDDASGSGFGGEVQEDEVPEPPAEPITKQGDLWLLGQHRLLCGDSMKAEDVERLMAGAKADLCFTSPPYGQQRDYTKESDCSDWNGLMRGVFGNLPMADKGQVLVNLGLIHRDNEWIPYWDDWIEWMRSQGWRRFGWYVWDQGFGLPGDWNGRFAPSHEWVFHFNQKNITPSKWVDKQPENIKPRNAMESTMRRADGTTVAFTNPGASAQPTKVPDSVIRIGRQVGSDGHPAQFSVPFASAFMLSWPGTIYEPFLGSGTTLIAAEQLDRKCYGMEISPAYCDVIVKRWETLTGKTATLEQIP